mmetsp:Transcript_590/g.1600  ORF Transcript_590/g.1600 Transcript_590/m.1600 type:complete len:220 (-) Transcript_590:53-712(-)
MHPSCRCSTPLAARSCSLATSCTTRRWWLGASIRRRSSASTTTPWPPSPSTWTSSGSSCSCSASWASSVAPAARRSGAGGRASVRRRGRRHRFAHRRAGGSKHTEQTHPPLQLGCPSPIWGYTSSNCGICYTQPLAHAHAPVHILAGDSSTDTFLFLTFSEDGLASPHFQGSSLGRSRSSLLRLTGLSLVELPRCSAQAQLFRPSVGQWGACYRRGSSG